MVQNLQDLLKDIHCNVADIDSSDNFVDNPLDKEPDGVTAIPDEVKAICKCCMDNNN